MNTVQEKEVIRLNLGGRETRIPGFKTVDLYDDPGKVDIHCDVSALPFDDGEVEEIYASHVLEHFSHTNTLDVLKEWNRVLKKGGRLFVSVPDFDRAVQLYLTAGLTDYLQNLLWGDQGYSLAYHYAGFTKARLMFLLDKAGFSSSKRISVMPYNVKDCSHLVDTMEGVSISLNVEATK